MCVCVTVCMRERRGREREVGRERLYADTPIYSNFKLSVLVQIKVYVKLSEQNSDDKHWLL